MKDHLVIADVRRWSRSVRVGLMVAVMLVGASGQQSEAVDRQPKKPVVVEGDGNPECGIGTITVGAAAVRTSPTSTATKLDRLPKGSTFQWCVELEIGGVGWLGIVYPKDHRSDFECKARAHGSGFKPYGGPCLSGWVARRQTQIAG
jgi:hypothetical protein